MKEKILAIGKTLDKAVDILETITGYTVFLFMILLFVQVTMRFVFKRPIYGIDEAVTALMIWTMSIGWSTVYWQNGHAVLEFIMKKMPTGFRRVIFNLINVIVMVITIAYIPASYTLFNMQKNMPPVGGLPMSRGYYYALPVLVMSIIMLILCAYKTIAFFVTGQEDIVTAINQDGGNVYD